MDFQSNMHIKHEVWIIQLPKKTKKTFQTGIKQAHFYYHDPWSVV
jgi:hypothetical protein